MIIFTLRRLLLLVTTLLFLLLLNFSLNYFPVDAPLQKMELWRAIFHWGNDLLHGDFGISSINGQPIITQLKQVLPATIELCLLAFCLALLIGVPIGMIAGVTHQQWTDKLISALALLGFSIPVFWLALLLTLLFSINIGWLPVSGRIDLLYEVKNISGFIVADIWLSHSPQRNAMLLSVLQHVLLPVSTLALALSAEVIRLMRISTIDIYEKNYIKAAISRGLSRLTILKRHVLHNALPTVIPRLGLQFSTLFTLTMIVEVVFSWPGIGRWLVNAIRQQDYAALSAGVLVTGTLVLTVNIFSDILTALADPLKHKDSYARG